MPTVVSRLADALVDSDPGLNRLRMGLAGALCVSAVIAAETALGAVLGLPEKTRLVCTLLGCVVAMVGSNALARPSARSSIKAAPIFPVALSAGLALGVAVAGRPLLSQGAFVLVMFAAVFIRRFGIDFFFYGFLIWIGFFFSMILSPTAAQLPILVTAVVTGTAVVLLLCTTVLRPHPHRTMRRIFRSMNARNRAILRACAEQLQARTPPAQDRAERALFDARTRFNETVLMSDGWAEYARALPAGWSAERLRRRLLDRQLTVDLTIWSTGALAQAPGLLRTQATVALQLSAEGETDRARRAAHKLIEMTAMDQRCKGAAIGLARAIAERAEQSVPPRLSEELHDVSDFQSADSLTALGTLPGAPSVSTDVTARGGRWNPFTRAKATTRQAVQVTVAGLLAILAGSAINDQRYYWAVIAAFVAFTGTGTRMETFSKSLNRVLGTVTGLGAGIALAVWTAGNTSLSVVVIVASIFCGFYLMRLSYAYMIFFITIIVAQLYSILGMFSDELLFYRLAETAVGAVIGTVVALVVTPVSTRDAVAKAESEVGESIAELMLAGKEASRQDDSITRGHIDALMIAVDSNLRRLSLVAAPLTRFHVWESRPRQVRHRMTVFTATVGAARVVIRGIEQIGEPSETVASACARVADLAHRLAANASDTSGAGGEGNHDRNEQITWDRPSLEGDSQGVGEAADVSGAAEQEVLLALQRLARLLTELPAEVASSTPEATGERT